MSHLLFTVTEVFTVHGYGIELCPGVRLEDHRVVKPGDQVELKRPDGSSVRVAIKALVDPASTIYVGPPPPERTSFVILPEDFQREDVPVGTEVWLCG